MSEAEDYNQDSDSNLLGEDNVSVEDLDFFGGYSPTFSTESNETQRGSSFESSYQRSYPTYEEKGTRGGMLLQGTVPVKLESVPYFDVIFTIKPIETENLTQFNMCIHSSKNSGRSGAGGFKSCNARLKFLGKYENVVLANSINCEGGAFCKDLDHSCRDEICSVCNVAFQKLDTIKSLIQTIKSDKYSMNSCIDFIPVLVDLKVRISITNYGSNKQKDNFVPNETYSVSVQSKKRKFSEQDSWTKRLRKDDSFSDITIKVGPELQHSFRAHKCVLSARSPVFSAMFQNEMKEKSSGQIDIHDTSPEIMEAFLYFLYDTDREKLISDPKITLDVLVLAHQYAILDLQQDCVECIIETPSSSINIELALSLFSCANRFSIPDLEFKAVQCIRRNKVQLQSQEGKDAIRDFMKCQYDLSPQLLIGLFSS